MVASKAGDDGGVMDTIIQELGIRTTRGMEMQKGF